MSNPNLDLPPQQSGASSGVASAPGVSSSALNRINQTRVPSSGGNLGRLAAAIARMPKPPGAKSLFLP